MSSADKTKLDALDPSGWASTTYARMKALLPGLGNSRVIDPGSYGVRANPASFPSGDANCEGGCQTAPAGTINSWGVSLAQSPKTGSFAIAFLGTLAGPTSAKTAQFGLGNFSTHDVQVATRFADDTTHYIVRMTGTSTLASACTLVADGAQHTFILWTNGTTYKVDVDGADCGASGIAASNTVSNEAFGLYVFNTTSGDAKFNRALYAW